MFFFFGGSRFLPGQISGLRGWWDAADLASITKDGSEVVTTWNDKSGGGWHVTQGTAGNKPSYSATAGPNSRPGIVFDGSDDVLSSASSFWTIDASSTHTIFAVTRRTGEGGSGAARMISAGTGTAGVLTSSVGLGTAVSYAFVNSTTVANQLSAVTTATRNELVAATANAGVVQAWDRGYPTATAGTHAISQTNVVLNIGGLNTAAGFARSFQGAICEVIVYSRVLTSAERQRVENYLSAKWGIALQRNKTNFTLDQFNSLLYWYKMGGANPSTFTGVLPNVTGVSDKSGNARDLAQLGTGSQQPDLGTLTQNGLNLLVFDGANALMTGTVAISGARTLIGVLKPTNLAGYGATHGAAWLKNTNNAGVASDFICSATSGGKAQLYMWESAGDDADGRHTTTDTVFVDNTAVIITATHPGAGLGAAVIYANGTSKAFGDGATTTGFGTEGVVGRSFADTTTFWEGGMGEIAGYNRVLTAIELDIAHSTSGILNTEWAVF